MRKIKMWRATYYKNVYEELTCTLCFFLFSGDINLTNKLNRWKTIHPAYKEISLVLIFLLESFSPNPFTFLLRQTNSIGEHDPASGHRLSFIEAFHLLVFLMRASLAFVFY